MLKNIEDYGLFDALYRTFSLARLSCFPTCISASDGRRVLTRADQNSVKVKTVT